jgi:hypothetical protein
MTSNNNEKVNHPSHYNKGKIEVIDFIEDQKLNFNLGNVIKYTCRHDLKGNPYDDLKKGLWFLLRELGTYDEDWKVIYDFILKEMKKSEESVL